MTNNRIKSELKNTNIYFEKRKASKPECAAMSRMSNVQNIGKQAFLPMGNVTRTNGLPLLTENFVI